MPQIYTAKVFDFTAWAAAHPGGAQAIKRCPEASSPRAKRTERIDPKYRLEVRRDSKGPPITKLFSRYFRKAFQVSTEDVPLHRYHPLRSLARVDGT